MASLIFCLEMKVMTRPYQFLKYSLLTALITSFCVPSTAEKLQKYVVYKAKSHFKVFIYKAGFAKAFVDDHTISAKAFEAELNYDEKNLANIQMSLSIETSSLVVESREIDKDDKTRAQQKMREQLGDDNHKRIEFKSSKVKVKSRKALKGSRSEQLKLMITGWLTMNGRKRRLRMPVEMLVSRNRLTAEGSVLIHQSDWGIKPYRSFLGAVRYKDMMKVAFKIVSQRRFC